MTGEFPETNLAQRIEPAQMPSAPKSTYTSAEKMRWDVKAWDWTLWVPATLYVESSEEPGKEHNAGDVRYDGYYARTFCVQARDPKLPLGFQAYFVGKRYLDERTAPSGGFDFAHVVDPVGVPKILHTIYDPIRQLRGDYETDASFGRRKDDAQKQADEMTSRYNDGTAWYDHRPMFTGAKAFATWLNEWKSFNV